MFIIQIPIVDAIVPKNVKYFWIDPNVKSVLTHEALRSWSYYNKSWVTQNFYFRYSVTSPLVTGNIQLSDFWSGNQMVTWIADKKSGNWMV